MSKGLIIYADDEERMRRLVSDFLTADGYNVITCADGKEAVDTFDSNPDAALVILDIMMPRMNGLKALEKIRALRNVPVILLTAKGGEYDELLGFRLGVDEYIVKPVRPKILVARVNALLNRSGSGPKEKVIEAGGIHIDVPNRSVSVEGSKVELTGKEFDLLIHFITNKNIVCSRESILESVWDHDYFGDERTVDTHVKKLRAKLKKSGEHIKTVWAVGYKFEDS